MNWPLKSKPVKRNGCFEGCVLLVVGAIAAAIALPSFLTIKHNDPIKGAKLILMNIYKECVYLQATKKEGASLSLLYMDSMQPPVPRHLDWEIVDLESRNSLDPGQDCFRADLLAIPIRSKSYKQLAYGLNLQNGQKSCITRDGEKHDDWSCE